MELNISCNPQLTFDKTDISAFKSLETLDVSYCSPTDYGFRYIAELPVLRSLIISFNGSETEGKTLAMVPFPEIHFTLQACSILDVFEEKRDWRS